MTGGLGLRAIDGAGAWTEGSNAGVPGRIGVGFSTAACGEATGGGTSLVGSVGATSIGGGALYSA